MAPRRKTELRHPLSLPVVHILLALTDGARHGYAIKQAVEDLSEGDIRLGPGTLYEAIQRLEDAAYIEETEVRDTPENGPAAQRREHPPTPKGPAGSRTAAA